MKLEMRFWAKVAIKPDSCWEWTGSRNHKGYGEFAVRPKVRKAHRVSWELHFGPIPDGLLVLHHCDNPPCVNPAHLFLGTPRDNWLDAKAKGRLPSHLGDRNPNRKLAATDVQRIRVCRALGERSADLAVEYGVAQSTIIRANNGGTWR